MGVIREGMQSINFLVSEEHHAALVEIARRNDEPISRLMRRVVRQVIAAQTKTAPGMVKSEGNGGE